MRLIVLLNIGLWVLLLVVFTTSRLPGNTFFWHSMQNAGHGLAMCLAAFTSILSFAWKSPQHTRLIFIIAPTALFVLGVLIELVQHLIGRGASPTDIILDTAGIVAGMCFSTLFLYRIRWALKLPCLTIGLLAISWCLHKPAYLLANKYLSPPLPVIANFEQFAAEARIHSHKSTFTVGNHQAVWPANKSKSLQVDFANTKWNDFRIVELIHDWTSYNTLEFEVLNVQNEAVSFNIELDYQPGTESHSATMMAKRVIEPGLTSISISLEEFLPILSQHEPNFVKIKRVLFCITSPQSEVTLYFDDIRMQ